MKKKTHYLISIFFIHYFPNHINNIERQVFSFHFIFTWIDWVMALIASFAFDWLSISITFHLVAMSFSSTLCNYSCLMAFIRMKFIVYHLRGYAFNFLVVETKRSELFKLIDQFDRHQKSIEMWRKWPLEMKWNSIGPLLKNCGFRLNGFVIGSNLHINFWRSFIWKEAH